MTDPGTPPKGARPSLVVGLGSADRGDDGIGPVVAGLVHDEVRAHGPDGVHVVVHEDPTALLDLFQGRDVVVIVDAVRTGAVPGTVTQREAGRGEPILPAGSDPRAAGTHGFGLVAALELARALDRLPERVVVVGIEATCFEHGRALSTPVAAAADSTAGMIVTILRTRASQSLGPSPPE